MPFNWTDIFNADYRAAERQHQRRLRDLQRDYVACAQRTVMHDGREHLIVPVVALTDGVVHAVNTDSPERVTSATLARAAPSFNGRPLTWGHPKVDGQHVSANNTRVLESQACGVIFNSRMSGERLLMDAYVDIARAEQVAGAEFVQDLRDGKPCAVSPGIYVTKDNTKSWAGAAGDHLALLPPGAEGHGRTLATLERSHVVNDFPRSSTMKCKPNCQCDQCVRVAEAATLLEQKIRTAVANRGRQPDVVTPTAPVVPDIYGPGIAKMRAAMGIATPPEDAARMESMVAFRDSFRATSATARMASEQPATTRTHLEAPDPYGPALERLRQERRR